MLCFVQSCSSRLRMSTHVPIHFDNQRIGEARKKDTNVCQYSDDDKNSVNRL